MGREPIMRPLFLFLLPKGSYIEIGGVGEYTDADLWAKCPSADKACSCFRERLASRRYFVPRSGIVVDPTDIVNKGAAEGKGEAKGADFERD